MAKRDPFPRSKSFIFYDGPSMLNPSEQVMGIVQLVASQASKTEGMLQSWVFPSAIKTAVDAWEYRKKQPSPCKIMLDKGMDRACCHNCDLRGKISGGSGECYCHGQVLMFGANMMLKAMSRNGWPTISMELLEAELMTARMRGDLMRNTAYGEPMCLPDQYLLPLVTMPGTGYTHAWDEIPMERAWIYQRYMMASVRPEKEAAATEMGWRCFVMQEPDQYSINKETQAPCPASAEAGRKSSCGSCKACSGKQGSHWKNMVIINHSRENNLKKANAAVAAKRNQLEMTLRIV